jgi:Na+-driven multidrug efflux pump
LIFIAHFGDEAMIAGVGMGNMINNIICLSIIMGMNGAVETLIS